MRCQDFPCCGHESGCCPDYDESGRQLNMRCTCGAVVSIDARYSICESCMDAADDERDALYDYDDYDDERDQFNDDMEADADALASAGWGTDEDYGGYEDYGDFGYDGCHEE